MAPAARRPRAALALLLALAALGPAAPASTWAPRVASEAAGPARAGGTSTGPRPPLGATGVPAGATNLTGPAGALVEPPGSTQVEPPAGTALQPPEEPGTAVPPEPSGPLEPSVPPGPAVSLEPSVSPEPSVPLEPAPCPGCPGGAAGTAEPGSGEPSLAPAAGSTEGLPGGSLGPPAAPSPGPPRAREPPEPWSSTPTTAAPEAGGSVRAGPDAAAAPGAPGTAGPSPAGRPVAEILDVDYYELLEGAAGAGRAAATPWALRELYDDFTPFDEADFYPTTSFYGDGDDEADEDDLDEEDEDEEEAGGLEDENGTRAPTAAAPGIPAAPAPAAGPADGSAECRSGFARHNGSCRSLCDLVPGYCHNGGHCHVLEGLGAFCRCNTQAYTWHKGPRCEAVVTDFQVLCVAVGSAALVLLLLLLLTVFFAKKLYLLKTENSKLRKSKYRSPSELHNDNFSLSTIAEGSHGHDDGGPKAQEPPLPPGAGKEEDEEAFVPGAPSPKRPPAKAEPDGAGTNCLPNNLA